MNIATNIANKAQSAIIAPERSHMLTKINMPPTVDLRKKDELPASLNNQIFKVCRIHLNSGYHYAGTLLRTRFVGNKLLLVLSAYAEIECYDKDESTKYWKPISRKSGPYNYEFEGCILDHQKSCDKKSVYESSIGDIIELSSHPQVCNEVSDFLLEESS